MRNEEQFTTLVNEAAAKKYEASAHHGLSIKDATKIFKKGFGKDPKDIKLIKDTVFYKNGYPNENSPGKLHKIFAEFAAVLKYYNYLGMERELEGYFKMFGFSSELTSLSFYSQLDAPIKAKDSKKLTKTYNQLFHPDDEYELENISKSDLLHKLLGLLVLKEQALCDIKDEVKFKIEPEAEEECDVQKKHFSKVVALKVQDLKKGNVKENLEKLELDREELDIALSVLKED
jgi:hypothetical protein